MSVANTVNRMQKLVIDNSPQILTAIGIVGTVSTAVLTGKAAYKAAELIAEQDYAYALRPKEKLELTWKFYVPAAGTGLLTVTAIFGANHIGTRRAAGLVAAYSLSEKAFDEYREKVTERMGAKQEQAVRDDIARDRVANTSGAREIYITGTDVLCLDTFSGRYFQSSMEELKKAQNDINYQIINDTYASLSDLYDKMGLSKTKFSDEVGWSHVEPLELEISTALTEDGRPCLAVSFRSQPIRDYYQFH